MKAVITRVGIILGTFAVLITAGTVGFSVLEGLAPADAFYFTIVTISTVGYGDIHPVTTAGKILAAVVIVVGLGAFLGVIADTAQLLLRRKQEQQRQEQRNTLTGIFFSQIGTPLLRLGASLDSGITAIRDHLIIKREWHKRDFTQLQQLMKRHRYDVVLDESGFESVRGFLSAKNDLLIQMFGNQNLLENESFTELLRAIFHLYDEISLRPGFEQLPDSDKRHLNYDLTRAYALLAQQWVSYMRHLKRYHPYLFSLAMRTNPFSEETSPIVI